MVNAQPTVDTMRGKSVVVWNVNYFDMQKGLKLDKLKQVMVEGDVEIAFIVNAFSPKTKDVANNVAKIKEKLNKDGGNFDVHTPELTGFPTDNEEDEANHDAWNTSHPPNMLIINKKRLGDVALAPEACTIAVNKDSQPTMRIGVCWLKYKDTLFVCYHRTMHTLPLREGCYEKWLESELKELGIDKNVVLLGVPVARAIDFHHWTTRNNPAPQQSGDIDRYLIFLKKNKLTKSALNSDVYMFLTVSTQALQPHKAVYYQPAGPETRGSLIRAKNIMLFRLAETSDQLPPMGGSWKLYNPEESSDELYEKIIGRLAHIKLELPDIFCKTQDKLTAIIANIDIKKEEEPDVPELHSDEDD
ncbi:unnamed protein product, partial [Mesorhabditis spiculigera]